MPEFGSTATAKPHLIRGMKTCGAFTNTDAQAGSGSRKYHNRSLAETTMCRLKTIFGGNVCSRLFDNQATELLLQCAVLNRMIEVAKPDTVWVDD